MRRLSFAPHGARGYGQCLIEPYGGSTMSAKLTRLALFAGALFLLAGSADAASFNCAKAKTPDEKAICANPALSDLDTQMAALFGVRMKVPMLMGSRGAAGDEQVQWLQTRGSCGA